MSPSGVHLPGGDEPDLVLVDEAWTDALPRCSVCGAEVDATFFRCTPCHAVICRACVSADTEILECDCEHDFTEVQLAATRASALLAR
jgi:hypothetical protein